MNLLSHIFFLFSFCSLSRAFICPCGRVASAQSTRTLDEKVTWRRSTDAATPASFHPFSSIERFASNKVDEETERSWRIDPLYAALVLVLLTWTFVAPGEFGSAQDFALLENYIANPGDPEGFSAGFLALFNLLGLIPLIAASVVAPQSSPRGLPLAPFLAASAAAGYFAAGTYLTFRAAPRESVIASELGWFTRNVLENKIFNWGLVASVAFIVYSNGLVEGVAQGGVGPMWQDFVGSISNSKFASVSSADAIIYNLAIASLIARDYKLRVPTADDTKANQVASLTLLLPFLGATLYCAVRPKLPE